MAEEHQAEHIRNPAVSYERRDLSLRVVLIFFLALAITLVLAVLILWGMFRSLGHGRLVPQPTSTAIATPERELPGGDPARTFPAPQLQPNPAVDLNKFRAREAQILNSYGWVDKGAGIARIPIERAMQLVVQRGLPARTPGEVMGSAPGSAKPANAGGTAGTKPATTQSGGRQTSPPKAQSRAIFARDGAKTARYRK